MSKTDILEVHKNCLDYLLNYQSNHTDFYFVPRKYNNKHRLEQGMYFLGNEDYMVLSFWEGGDSKEFIYNINFSVSNDGKPSLELSCRDRDERVSYVIAIKDLIEKEGKKFKETKVNRWRYFYSDGMSYLEALQDFIENEKPMIDQYLSQNPQSGIILANKDTDNKYVKKLPGYDSYIEAIHKAKKTGSVTAKASEYIMTFQHNQLSNEFERYLKDNGYTCVVTDEDFVDIKATDNKGKKIFFELKTATSVKLAIRQAIGQLLEYNHYPNKSKADKLIIVTIHEPEKEDMQYLMGLRTIYNIPVWYQWFDMDNKVLSQEY